VTSKYHHFIDTRVKRNTIYKVDTSTGTILRKLIMGHSIYIDFYPTKNVESSVKIGGVYF